MTSLPGPLHRLLALPMMLALTCAAAPAVAAASPAAVAEAAPALAALQQLDRRVQSAGWRLARGNAPFCRHRTLAIGLQLHDAYNYDDPQAVRAALGLGSDIAVQAVAAASPASRAGLAANDALGEVAGTAVPALPPVRPGDYARVARLHLDIEQALGAGGQVALTVLRPGAAQRIVVPGEEVCATRFEMVTAGNRAAADGVRVIVSRKLVEFLTDDEHLATLLAHELAHNVLGHRTRLDASGRGWARVLATEREADRLSLWLLANAGYDPAAGLRFMARWGPQNDHGIFSTPDHDRWKTRLKRMTAELTRVRAAQRAGGGAADWASAFVAEPAPRPRR